MLLFLSLYVYFVKILQKHNEKAQSLQLCKTKIFESNIKYYVNEMTNVNLPIKLFNTDFVAKEVK